MVNSQKKLLLLGSGGRENALAWKLSQSPAVERVYTASGHPSLAHSLRDLNPLDFEAVLDFCQQKAIDAVIIGPEAPLVAGLADVLTAAKIPVFGPNQACAQLEGSKIFAKQFMDRSRVATAPFVAFQKIDDALDYLQIQDEACVIKYDGLAAGKGVFVCANAQEAEQALLNLQANYGPELPFLIEDCLQGDEISIMGLVANGKFLPLLPSQDHKALLDQDQGPNTGGMGCFCPIPDLSPELWQAIEKRIIQPSLAGLAKEGLDYCGFLYFGIMVTAQGPYLLEYNARLGDPETQVLLPALQSDLWVLIEAALTGRLAEVEPPSFHSDYFVNVVLAAKGYPHQVEKGQVIRGLAALEQHCPDVLVFHAGTDLVEGQYLVSGGRVLHLVAQGPSLAQARNRVYDALAYLDFEGKQFRSDIGLRSNVYLRTWKP